MRTDGRSGSTITTHTFVLTRSRFGHDAKARYDESLAVTDTHLKTLLKAIDLDKTLVVLASDHGQGLGTHGDHGHGSNLYEEDILVPLVFAGPGIKPQRLQDLVSNVDLVPTVQQPPESSERRGRLGRSHAGAGDVRSKAAEKPVFAEALPDPHTNDHAWAMRLGDEKLIHDLKRQTLTLYNLTEDPMERSGREPGTSADQDLVRRLNAHRATAAWINKGDYGGKRRARPKPKPRLPDRIEGDLDVQVGEWFRSPVCVARPAARWAHGFDSASTSPP